MRKRVIRAGEIEIEDSEGRVRARFGVTNDDLPFLSFYAREYGASGTLVGAVVGVYSIMQFFFAPVWGRLSDRIGRKPVRRWTCCGPFRDE